MKDYQVYTVGGAVRDMLMGLEPKDYDYVVVGSTPEKMLAMGFQQVGADFPVFLNERGEEFALARTERKTGDGYLGFETETDNVSLNDDLYRRDLTINAMARADDGTIVDPYGGQRDIKNKVLRHVSDAFSEDPLRVVRLARFYARYTDFTVSAETWHLCAEIVKRGDLNSLSIERFWAELEKVFTENDPGRFFYFLEVVGAFEHVAFFRDLYAHNDAASWARHVKNSGVNDPVMHHTAITGKPGAVLNSADNRTKNLHANLAFARTMTRSVEDMYKLLKMAKAWSSGPGAQDLCDCSLIVQVMGEKHAFGPYEVAHAIIESAKITAASFPDEPQGKRLGVLIESGRKSSIMTEFNLPFDTQKF